MSKRTFLYEVPITVPESPGYSYINQSKCMQMHEHAPASNCNYISNANSESTPEGGASEGDHYAFVYRGSVITSANSSFLDPKKTVVIYSRSNALSFFDPGVKWTTTFDDQVRDSSDFPRPDMISRCCALWRAREVHLKRFHSYRFDGIMCNGALGAPRARICSFARRDNEKFTDSDFHRIVISRKLD